MSEPAPCQTCGEASSFRCSICKKTRYCSRQCQRRDWPKHKLTHDKRPSDGLAVDVPAPDVPGARRRATGLRDLVQAHREDEEEEEVSRPLGGLAPRRPPPAPPRPAAANPLDLLPPELLTQVFESLPPTTLARCTAVCKGWRAQCEADDLWKPHLDARGIPAPGIPAAALPQAPATRRAPRAAGGGLSALRSLRQRGDTVGISPPEPPKAATPLIRLYGDTVGLEQRWQSGRYAQHELRGGHSWTVEALELVELPGHGRLLVSGSWDGGVCVWRVRDGSLLQRWAAHNDWVSGLACNETIIVSGSTDRTAKVWKYGRPEALHTLQHLGSVTSVRLLPGGGVCATTSVDHSAYLWNLATGQELRRLTGHRDVVWSVRALPMMGGAEANGDGIPPYQLVTGSRDGTARRWETATGRCTAVLRAHDGPILAMEVSPERGTVATGGVDSVVRIWGALPAEVGGGEGGGMDEEAPQLALRGHSQGVLGVAFTGGGLTVVSSSMDSSVRVWDLRAGGGCRAVISEAAAPVMALATWGAMAAALSPGDAVTVYDTAPGGGAAAASSSGRGGKEAAPGGHGGATSPRQQLARPASRVSRMRGEVAASRQASNGATAILSLMDGVHGYSHGNSVTCDKSSLAIGCKDGTIVLLDFAAPESIGGAPRAVLGAQAQQAAAGAGGSGRRGSGGGSAAPTGRDRLVELLGGLRDNAPTGARGLQGQPPTRRRASRSESRQPGAREPAEGWGAGRGFGAGGGGGEVHAQLAMGAPRPPSRSRGGERGPGGERPIRSSFRLRF